jgi:putative aldouronate transport system substrate-binding protein
MRRLLMKKSVKIILSVMVVISITLQMAVTLKATDTQAAPDPLGKSTPTITVTYARAAGTDNKFPDGQSFENNIWMTEYEKVLGIKIKTIWTTEGNDYDTKLNLCIASNDLPDIFKVRASQLKRLVDSNLVEDLTGTLASYGSKQVKDLLAADGKEALKQMTFKGKIMALPQNSALPGGFQYIFIRDDWRIKLKMPVPKTMGDLYNLAKAFVTKDPDGNGKADTFGLTVGNVPYDTFFAMTGFFNGFGAYPDQWIEKNNKLVYGGTQPEMKKALVNLKKYYDEKMIDKEFVVKDCGKASQDAVAGKSGIAYGQFWVMGWPLGDTFKTAVKSNWTAYAIPFDSSVSVKAVGAKNKVDAMYVVRKGFEHPEALVKMYNLFSDRIYGGKADLTKYKSDGKFDYQGDAAVINYTGVDRNPINSAIVTKAIDEKNPALLENEEMKVYYDKINNFLNHKDEGVDKNADNTVTTKYFYGTGSLFGIQAQYQNKKMFKSDLFYGPDTVTMQKKWAILRQSEYDMIINIITGVKPLTYFDEFVKNWESLGGSQITSEVNNWRDSVK